MLIDPYQLDEGMWNVVRNALKGFIEKGIQIVAEVFTCDKNIVEFRWFCGPKEMEYPVAVIDRKKYHLAVYATDKLKADVSKVCLDLGWNQYNV